MSSQTLAQAQLLIVNKIVKGVAQDIITLNPIFNYMPFSTYTGQALLVNRELALGNAQTLAVGSAITAKLAATFTQVPFTATKIIGDAEMDGLVQAQSASAGVNQIAVEIASKAKSVGRAFQNGIANGTGVSPDVNSLFSLCDAAQYTTASATQVISFAGLDECMDLVKAKDGQVDWLMMPPRTLRSTKSLYRALGGVLTTEVLNMPDGTNRVVYLYEDVPIFKNEWLSVLETANGAAQSGGVLTSVWAGVWDDGSQKVGCAAIYPEGTPAGIQVKYIGEKELADEGIYRVKWYVNFGVFNRRGLARLPSISN